MSATDRRIPIIVLAGQSNANSTQLSLEAFKQVAAAGGMLVHMAMNGSALSDRLDTGSGTWNAATGTVPMGVNLTALCAQLWSILNPGSPSYVPGAYLDSVIWVQGEADAFNSGAAADYGANLRAVHAELTARFGTHDLVVSALSDAPDAYRSFAGNHAANCDMIRAQQRALADDLATVQLVDPDQVAARAGMTADAMFRWDYVHYDDSTGFAGLLGRTLAAAALGPAGAGASALATRTPQVAQVHAGTAGNDAFTVSLSAFRQVMAGPGHDAVTVIAPPTDLSLIEVTSASTRILAGVGATARILDLIAVEEVTLGAGHDTVVLGGGVTTVTTGAGVDRATGFARDEVFNMGRGNDLAHGGTGNDTLRGDDGNDQLWGDADNDFIFGGTGNDTLQGDDGADVLSGGRGNDALTGGAGADVFVFGLAGGLDCITDFNPDEDMVQLLGISAGQLTLRAQGADVLLTAGTTRVILTNVSPDAFDHGNLVFL